MNPVYRIGSALFVSLVNPNSPSGAPELCGVRSEVLQRPGIDGASVRLGGIDSRPFRMVGKVDGLSEATALETRAAYRALVGTRQQITWRDVNFHGATLQHEYVVLGVEATWKPIGANVGGLTGPDAGVWIESLWTLLPIDLTTVADEED